MKKIKLTIEPFLCSVGLWNNYELQKQRYYWKHQ